MHTPNSTYRIQFHKNFNFQRFEQIIGYLKALGVDTVYASPILQAVPGSTHGYDGTDTGKINPEIGSLRQFKALQKRLREHQLKWIQDIVPNHMAYHPDNTWLMDILEFGESSPYKSYFDTAYASTFMSGKLMVPILGKSLPEAVESHEIHLVLHKGKLYLRYVNQQFPVSPSTYEYVIKTVKAFADRLDKTSFIAPRDAHFYHDRWPVFIKKETNRNSVEHLLKEINNDKQKLSYLVEQQHYRLCHWQETDQNINFRRFFTVNGLICLNTHRPEVFEDTHAFIKKLLAQGFIDGLRLDHIDGLYDPTTYLKSLRKLVGADTYIVAEKILEHGEELPDEWPIQGTTGYDFLAFCNQVSTARRSNTILTEFYEKWTGDSTALREQQIQKKASILAKHMQGELANLYRFFGKLKLNSDKKRIEEAQWKEAISAFLIYFPVYRLYENAFPFADDSYNIVTKVFDDILKDRYADRKAVKHLKKVFDRAQHHDDPGYRQRAISFWLRCMQFTGPLMAKGVEDTLMYTYHRFIAHNEVGDHPSYFGISKKEFHHHMVKRQQKWPFSLNGSSTHDTKRGEDVRARLQVLSAIPKRWITEVERWQDIIKTEYQAEIPDPNDVYFLYQTLFGAYPMPGETEEHFEERLHAYLEKYLREGKLRSNWAEPNEEYEQRLKNFASFLLNKNEAFFPVFKAFLHEWADVGIIQSLTQLILKFTCPGVPDIYQGTELWDLSFVDPDNRRPIDYDLRQKYLKAISGMAPDERCPTLWEQRYDGKIKLWLTHVLLRLRGRYPDLFTKGDYIPLTTRGKGQKHILSYARKYRHDWLITIVPLHLGGLAADFSKPGSFDWGDTYVEVPADGPSEWESLLDPAGFRGYRLSLNNLLGRVPFAILSGKETEKTRSAGILMHISSLPSRYGVGDLGEGAFDFAERLQKSGQHWWQILPLGPTSAQQYHSPYSTWSAMAGNPLLIDPEFFVEEGLLDRQDLLTAQTPEGNFVDFKRVETQKTDLLRKAYKNVKLHEVPGFRKFCHQNAYWLHDYALFVVLHKQQNHRPWYTWDPVYKSRDREALNTFAGKEKTAIDEVKWQQFIFFEQWQRLRGYCHDRNIRLLGDVPIYVAHDSSDVWANPDLFALRENGTLRKVAGVPPDYFNAEGQLWGMPVFDWPTLKKKHYKWWVRRLSHNRTLFDLVRLDHFRAFSAYWEVDADEKTAINGRWKTGPGEHFFHKIKSTLGELPFLAEDLGDIDENVHRLREALGIPGMKVLQFAFGEDMQSSPYIPHHYERDFFVYTGTHDNNTTSGWYAHDLNRESKKRLCQYMGKYVDDSNVCENMIRLAYSSVARTAIVPMQDVLGLGEETRMNSPATTRNNWTWRMMPDSFTENLVNGLLDLAKIYGRY